jgi:hypothetical protein
MKRLNKTWLRCLASAPVGKNIDPMTRCQFEDRRAVEVVTGSVPAIRSSIHALWNQSPAGSVHQTAA